MSRRGGLEPFAVTLRDGSGVLAVALPLVRERRGLTRIGFADSGLADYNAPLVGPAVPRDEAAARALQRALLAALPPADVLRFERMPRSLLGSPNPFAAAAQASSSRGLAIDLSDGFEAWRGARPRRYRMELGRCRRLFEDLPDARHGPVAAADGPAILAHLERLQRARADHLAMPYALDDPHVSAFHRALVGGPGILHALQAEGRVLAVLFGLRLDAAFVMLRVAADADYARLSPARLLIVLVMERLAAEGVRTIDLGLGDYDYKRRLGAEPTELVDLVLPRSWRGLSEVAAHRARAAVRARPALHRAAQRFRGRAVPPPV